MNEVEKWQFYGHYNTNHYSLFHWGRNNLLMIMMTQAGTQDPPFYSACTWTDISVQPEHKLYGTKTNCTHIRLQGKLPNRYKEGPKPQFLTSGDRSKGTMSVPTLVANKRLGRPPKPPLCWIHLSAYSPHLRETAHPPAAHHTQGELKVLILFCSLLLQHKYQ